MYRFVDQFLGESLLATTLQNIAVIPYYKWKIVYYGADGVLYKTWYANSDYCPIRKFDFELTNEGTGDGKLTFHSIDYIPTVNDFVIIYLRIDGAYKKIYRGYVEETPDLKSGNVKLSSFMKKFKNVIHSDTYTTQTIEDIWEDVITTNQEKTGISWNGSLVDTGRTDIISKKFDSQTIYDILDEDVETFEDRITGVNADGFLFVKEKDSEVSYILYDTDYISASREVDAGKIKLTRADVYQKSGTGITYIGQVGYDSTYPAITALENEVGVIEGKVTANKDLSTNDALQSEYDKIRNQSLPIKYKVKGVDYTKFPIEIGQKIRYFTKQELRTKILLDCETLTEDFGQWNGCELSATAKKGTYSIQVNQYGNFTWNYYQNYANIIKIGFFVRPTENNQTITLLYGRYGSSWGEGNWGEGNWGESDNKVESAESSIRLTYANRWQWVEAVVDIEFFNQISFASSANFLIDQVAVYGYTAEYYDFNVNKISFDIENENDIMVDISGGDTEEMITAQEGLTATELEELRQANIT